MAAALVCATLGFAGAAGAAEQLPPQGASPAGTNDFDCVPDRRHPYPVVLVHGTFGNMQVSWGQIVPPLKRLGYCVFALDYGNSPAPGINGTGDIPTSAAQLKSFVERVLEKTQAPRVAIVGHSQGGMLPRHYLKFLGGEAVDEVVGLSPSSRGTTNPAAIGVGPFCAACLQQVAGSEFMQMLNAGDETPGFADYTVIETRYDEVVTPYQSEFLRPDGNDVTNVLLQDRCPGDLTEHVGIIFDPPAIQWMLNALGRPGPADPDFQPDCSGGAAALEAFPNSRSDEPEASLRVNGLNKRARATVDRKLRLTLRPTGPAIRKARIVIFNSNGSVIVGRSKPVYLTGKRTVTVRLKHPLAPGRYNVNAIGSPAAGASVAVASRLRLR